MNCTNCGAPMELMREQDYFYCRYCGAFHFPAKNMEGVRVLDELPYPMECPLCHEPFFRASINMYPAMHCKKCRGTLMQQLIFGEVVQYLRAQANGPSEKPRPLNAKEMARKIRCPNCSVLMEVHPYAGPGNIFIDTCANCNLIWLDYGEINRVVNAPGRDRGQPWYIDEVEE
jgi:Zn-finger nucleic acid-binding protein